MNPEMFREYDIRGIAGKDMTEHDVFLIEKSVGTFLLQHGRQQKKSAGSTWQADRLTC